MVNVQPKGVWQKTSSYSNLLLQKPQKHPGHLNSLLILSHRGCKSVYSLRYEPRREEWSRGDTSVTSAARSEPSSCPHAFGSACWLKGSEPVCARPWISALSANAIQSHLWAYWFTVLQDSRTCVKGHYTFYLWKKHTQLGRFNTSADATLKENPPQFSFLQLYSHNIITLFT